MSKEGLTDPGTAAALGWGTPGAAAMPSAPVPASARPIVVAVGVRCGDDDAAGDAEVVEVTAVSCCNECKYCRCIAASSSSGYPWPR